MDNELISIIVPIYNVEKYLKKCLDSILAQTYTNLEIILIDDGSPDGCPAICDEYAEKDDRIVVIHKENGGVSSARNAGLENVSGEFIGWVDPDDYIEPNMFEELYKNIKENNSDIAICSVKHFGYENRIEKYDNSVLSGDEFLRRILNGKIKSYLCNKLFSKNIFDSVVFPYGENYEDHYIMHLIAEKAQKVSTIGKPLYFYRIWKKSITFSNKGKKAKAYLKSSNNRVDYFYNSEFYVDAIQGKLSCLRTIVSDMSNKCYRKELKHLIDEAHSCFNICKKQLSLTQKIMTYIFFISPSLFRICKKILIQIKH